MRVVAGSRRIETLCKQEIPLHFFVKSGSSAVPGRRRRGSRGKVFDKSRLFPIAIRCISGLSQTGSQKGLRRPPFGCGRVKATTFAALELLFFSNPVKIFIN